jgi:glutathione S-transferase
MVTLHIANKNYSSWSLRPWVLMRTLDIPFEERLSPFSGAVNPAFKAFSPTGRVPCLVDDGDTVWDSLAIMEYLAERHSGVWPTDARARAWARCAAAEMHSSFQALRNQCGMSCGVRVTLHTMPDALRADIARVSELWREGFERFGGPFLAGARFTAVDAMFAPVTFRALTYGLDFGPEGNRYAAMVRDLPAMRDWYDAALAEAWREAAHEEEIAVNGVITADLRA